MKAVRRESVIFSALVYDPDVTVRGGFFVRYQAVQLPDFERSFVSIVIQAYRETGGVVFARLDRAEPV